MEAEIFKQFVAYKYKSGPINSRPQKREERGKEKKRQRPTLKQNKFNYSRSLSRTYSYLENKRILSQ